MSEGELRRRFAQMREADREQAPGFAQISESARARRSRRATLRVRPLVIGAAAAVAIAAVWLAQYAIALAVRGYTRDRDLARADGRSPRTPGSELLGAMPALGASVLDTMIPTPSNRGT